MELKELRNTMSFAYFLLNAIFVVFIFTMQQNTDQVMQGPEYFLIYVTQVQHVNSTVRRIPNEIDFNVFDISGFRLCL